jgi:hypothetical protein
VASKVPRTRRVARPDRFTEQTDEEQTWRRSSREKAGPAALALLLCGSAFKTM